MKRRSFIQKSVMATPALAVGGAALAQTKNQKEFYEFRVYEMKSSRQVFDNYLSKALIPALNKYGVKKVGAFTELGKSDPPKLYLLIPYASLDDYSKVTASLKKDDAYQQASTEYNQLAVDQAAYWRYESSFMTAFDGWPQMTAPPSDQRLFELRTYEGYSEDAVRRKVKMFNESEFEIFNRVKLNSVFFGEVISGKNLPCLTYMISFKNMEERDANWKAFLADPEWLRIWKLPEYANTVSKIYKTFLEPVSYSQV